MTPFHKYHPFTNFIFFFMVILMTGIMQSMALTLISCIAGLITFCVFKKKSDHTFWPLFALCLLAGLLNPLFSHHGATILFYINALPITLEASIYGLFLTIQLLQLILWFKVLSLSITSEHILCLFGSLSPRLALLFSMTLRFIPEFSRQFAQTENAAITQGLYKSDSIWSRIKGKSKVFLSVSGNALEKGIITADSMEARGYSLPGRTSYHRFRFRKRDAVVTCLILVLSLPLIISKITGLNRTVFYPTYKYRITLPGVIFILLPGLLLTLIPIILKIKEEGKNE